MFSVVGIVFLGLVFLAVRSSPGLTWLGVVLGVPATVLLVIPAVTKKARLCCRTRPRSRPSSTFTRRAR